MHFELMYPSKYLKAADLRGRDVTLTIIPGLKIKREELVGKNGKKDKKPIIYFVECREAAKRTGEEEKRMVLNVTNARSIAAAYSEPEMDNWGGFRITLYPSTHNGQDCIRVRDTIPPEPTTAKAEKEDNNAKG